MAVAAAPLAAVDGLDSSAELIDCVAVRRRFEPFAEEAAPPAAEAVHDVEGARDLKPAWFVQESPEGPLVVVLHLLEVGRPVLAPERRLLQDRARPRGAGQLVDHREVALDGAALGIRQGLHSVEDGIGFGLVERVPVDAQVEAALPEVPLE
ncbi:MAG: hypothetical protein HRF50_18220 [Phycisphaerae bacterium]